MGVLRIILKDVTDIILEYALKNKDLLITNSDAKTKKEFKDDFSTAMWEWLKPIFIKIEDRDDYESAFINAIENPGDKDAHESLYSKINDLVEKDEGFAGHLENLLDEIYVNYQKESKAKISKNINANEVIDSTIDIINKIN